MIEINCEPIYTPHSTIEQSKPAIVETIEDCTNRVGITYMSALYEDVEQLGERNLEDRLHDSLNVFVVTIVVGGTIYYLIHRRI